jgi:hypothetical protein
METYALVNRVKKLEDTLESLRNDYFNADAGISRDEITNN